MRQRFAPSLALALGLAGLAALADPAAGARRVVLAVDGSGSMRDAVGATSLGDVLGGFVARLAPDDELALIVFDERPALLRAPAPVGTASTAAVSQMHALTFEGQHSDLPAALAMACDLYPDATRDRPVDIVLVTDGVVTVPAPRSSATAMQDMRDRILPRCVGAGARIHVIGLGGSKANMEVLQSMAEASSGRSEFPLSAGRLAGFLDAYLVATQPPPAPVAAPEPRTPADVPVAEPAPAPSPSHALAMLGIAAVLLALAIVLLLLWRRSRMRSAPVGVSGTVNVRELASGLGHNLRLPATIGRSPSSPILVEDKEASRKHFRLEQAEGKVAVVDLGSANGTFLNGTRVREGESKILRPGDRLKIPGLELLVQPDAVDFDSTYIRQDLDKTFVRPNLAEPGPQR
jgi:hypothetical protein